MFGLCSFLVLHFSRFSLLSALFVFSKLEQGIFDLEASELDRGDDHDCLVQFLPATLLLKLCCCLPLRERMLSLFGGRALHQQVSSKYSQLFGRSPQNVAADRPGGALSRVSSPYNRCALGTCERSDAPAATERRIQPATRSLRARATSLDWPALSRSPRGGPATCTTS